MIIAETILSYLPDLHGDSHVAILCHDDLFADYLKSQTKQFERVRIYPSVPDFESALRLHLMENDEVLNDEIAREAEYAFYKSLDEESLFYRSGIPKRIQESYPTLFANPDIGYSSYLVASLSTAHPQTGWLPISEPEYRVSKPVFNGRQKEGQYLWDSTVKYRQIFTSESFKAYSGLGGFENRGELFLEFKVRWECDVSLTGGIKLTNSKVVNIEHIPNLPMGSYASLATSAGQGTVPVAFSPSPSPGPNDLDS